MNAVSGGILVVLLSLVCFAPRRWALLGMMSGVFFLTQGHSVNLAGLNLYPLRFLEAAAFARVLARGEFLNLRFNRIDWSLILFYTYGAAVWTLRSSESAAQQIASAVDPILCYLVFRTFLAELADLQWFLRAFVVLLVPYTLLVFLERLTGQSSFAIVGITDPLYVRNGVPRCQGGFRHAILLGSVAAAFLSLYASLCLSRRRRLVDLLGAGLCGALVVLTNSSGPLTSIAAASLGWLAWPLRRSMQSIRRTSVLIVFAVALFMNAPVWYLPFKISALIGGGGFHRGALMDRAWQDLGNWWLVGMDMKETIHWFPYLHDVVGGADITNQFIVYGLRAGLPALALSALPLVFAFKRLGYALATQRASAGHDDSNELLYWGIGVSLFVHVVSWLGVAYFDQSWAVWVLHLAGANSASPAGALSNAPVREGVVLIPTPFAVARPDC